MRKEAVTEQRSPEQKTLWYKDAVIYELHVRSFCDSNGDGIGDFKGATQKLDYLQFLGVNTVWLLPFYPSPLKDEGYDIANYTKVHPDYGTLADFKRFLREAHKRGIRVITELVINHTSDQHPWFQKARRAKPGTYWRDFYVWSADGSEYQDARIIFSDYEASNWSWDPVAKAYYWHRFYAHQPDLNYDNPAVREQVIKILDFWLAMGIDGLRLDAIPYLFEREGSSCENLPETHEFLKTIRRYVDTYYPDRMLLAEANQWPEDAVAYFGDDDECHMAYHFPIMPRMYMSIHMEDRFPMIAILEQTPAIPENAQWALFLRNHDELTLEMVTDEERDYMYRMFARDPKMRVNLGIRRRLAPLLGNDRRKIELMNGLMFSMPGTPIIYYGDEIGMGDNYYLGDRNGVRTPMQWSDDRNAGFSDATPQKLYLPVIIDPEYNYAAVNVAIQQQNPQSLLWWMKRMIAMRRRFQAFGRGSIHFLYPENRKILAFTREYHEEKLLIVANLSANAQYAELDMSAYQGLTPVELFGRTRFPQIGQLPYLLTLGPFAFYWFSLEAHTQRSMMMALPQGAKYRLSVDKDWTEILNGRNRTAFETRLANYLSGRRWFAGKSRSLRSVTINDVLPLSNNSHAFYLIVVHVDYYDAEPSNYCLPMTLIVESHAEELQYCHPEAVIAGLKHPSYDKALVMDATFDHEFSYHLLTLFNARKQYKGAKAKLTKHAGQGYRELLRKDRLQLTPHVNQTEQSNTSIIYNDSAVLKLFRRLDNGVNPEVEIGRFLQKHSNEKLSPALLADLQIQWNDNSVSTLAVLQEYVSNEGDAWSYTQDALQRFFENALSYRQELDPQHLKQPAHLMERAKPDDTVCELLNHYRFAAMRLGQRTAALHKTLACDRKHKAFTPERFTGFDNRSLYQSIRNAVTRNTTFLREQINHMAEDTQPLAQNIIDHEKVLLKGLHKMLDRNLNGMKTRTHGDYHLGQVLYIGNDFLIIDFEGEPERPLSERHIKRSPLRDVAGMVRSFHYAVNNALASEIEVNPEQNTRLNQWAVFWYRWITNFYVTAYMDELEGSDLLPDSQEDTLFLLSAYMLEKAVYEMGYEANNRPGWLWIPCRGLQSLIDYFQSGE